jgi:hypothetical protein
MSLDYNSIWSLINKNNLSKAKAARIAEMSETGFRQMMDRKTMAVSTLEKFAEYFKVPITAFFEDISYGEAPIDEQMQSPGRVSRLCKDCVEKQKEIDQLRQKLIEAQEKLSITQEKVISLIEAHDHGKSNQEFQKKNCG